MCENPKENFLFCVICFPCWVVLMCADLTCHDPDCTCCCRKKKVSDSQQDTRRNLKKQAKAEKRKELKKQK